MMLHVAALFASLIQVRPAPIQLRPGLVITRSARIVPKTYRLTAPGSLDSAVITVKGDNITVDFHGATLMGSDPAADPDRAAGLAIRIDGGRNVMIKNARVRGYKVAILARGTTNLTLLDNDLSNNWKPRLYSLVEHESLVDWLSFHHNEQDEWLRYGAAIYLVDVKRGTIRGNRVVQGMNGLLLVRSNGIRIEHNEFSFNSGLGIGLYRSSRDTILYNRVDFNVRGYSHRFYTRGQDSADLLLYEQSSDNVVAFNSMTHGGDGVFLWAGQSTMDTGAGGANDNLFYGNDFSFATANGIEATFSRNRFIQNRVWGNEYGIWGGYSYESVIEGNELAHNRTGIAIEHGYDNTISMNRLEDDSTGIRLWADSIEPSDWGYPKHRDTRSRNYLITDNRFSRNRVALRIARSSQVSGGRNAFVGTDTVAALRDTSGFGLPLPPARDSAPRAARVAYAFVESLPGRGQRPTSTAAARDRSAIVVDEWGPYDWKSPKLWPVDSVRSVPLRLRTLGPAGTWRVVARRGIAAISSARGTIGDTIAVTPAPDSIGDWQLTLESRGVSFSYGRFEPAIDWTARFFTWSDSAELKTKGTGAGTLLFEKHVPRLDYEWYRPPSAVAGLPRERWALEATGTVMLAPGSYSLRTISDDGIRVWIDGTLVIDAWSVHESQVDTVPLAAGRHALRVEYFQSDGWTELRFEIVRR